MMTFGAAIAPVPRDLEAQWARLIMDKHCDQGSLKVKAVPQV